MIGSALVWHAALGADPGELSKLASEDRAKGDYASAELRYKQTLKLREEGNDPLAVASALGNLAAVYYDQGKHSEAEPLYVRALAIYADRPGDPAELARIWNNLGAAYWALGRYGEAEPAFRKALDICARAGVDSVRAEALNNLGSLYLSRARFDEAGKEFQAGAGTGKHLARSGERTGAERAIQSRASGPVPR